MGFWRAQRGLRKGSQCQQGSERQRVALVQLLRGAQAVLPPPVRARESLQTAGDCGLQTCSGLLNTDSMK